MKKIKSRKVARRVRIRHGIRGKVLGTPTRPRLAVFRSNRHIYAQLIDDANGVTLATANTMQTDVREAVTGKEPIAAAETVGKLVAERAIAAGFSTIVFDRGGYRYHGRVKAVAEGAREGGLKF